MVQHGRASKHYSKWKELDTKSHGLCDSFWTKCLESQIHKAESRLVFVRGLREREKKNDCKWIQAFFGSNENVLTLIGVVAVQFCGSCESIQNLNCVNYVVCKVYLNKAVTNFFFKNQKKDC